jgi:ribonuclease-3
MSRIEKLLLQKYDEQNLSALEDRLQYCFKNKLLFIKALSHPSLKQLHDFKLYFDSQKYEFEKLEFLGDAVLSVVIIELLIDMHQRASEGNLAKMKNFLVSKKTLSYIAAELNLADFLLITDGEKKSGGQTSINNLENALEALIGAIYLDSDLAATKIVIEKLWHANFQNAASKNHDPKSSLQEIAQSMGLGLPEYSVIETSGSSSAPTFTILVEIGKQFRAQGVGKSKKQAQINAAQNLLLMISN